MSINTSAVLNEILISIEAVQNQVNALRDNAMLLARMSDPQPDGKRLPVPWLSQLGGTAAYAPGDCGAACLAMLINYGGRAVTVDEVSAATGAPRDYKTMPFDKLISAALKLGVKLQHVTATIDEICADVERDKPVIVLVNYSSIPLYGRYDARYNAGHYLLVVGYDAECIVYHDPYWPTADMGAYKVMTCEEFARAYTTVAPGNKYASHALRVV